MPEILPNGNWNEWFEKYGPKMLLYARQKTPSLADAEDVVQEAFVRFWKSPAQYRPEPHVYLFVLVRRVAIDQGRSRIRRKKREERAENWTENPPLFIDSMEEEENHRMIQESIEKLPEEQKEVLVLKIWGELTLSQIGRTLEISQNTAASRYRYALQNLRKNLA